MRRWSVTVRDGEKDRSSRDGVSESTDVLGESQGDKTMVRYVGIEFV